jgi:type IV secretion system protein VirB9
LSVLGALVFALLPWQAQAALTPKPGTEDPRIQSIPYDPDQVVLLRGTLGYQFMLQFDPAEKIETVSIGDALAWQVTPNRKANVLFIKPVSQSSTNLTVLTDVRRYAFELKVVPQSASQPVLYIAQMVYPAAAKAEPVPAAAPEAAPAVVNSAYTITGPDAERPMRVFDDGHMTYFQWAPSQQMPAIFAVAQNGSESLVNYVVRGPYVVVDEIAPGFSLRNGKDVVKVVNKGRTAR